MKTLVTILLCLAIPATGMSSGAMRFDGVDDYIALNNTIYSQNNAMTLSAWFRTDSSSTTQRVFARGIGSNDFTLQIFSNGIRGIVGGNGGGQVVGSSASISSDTWYHVALVFDGVTLDLYLNGALKHSDPAVTTTATTAQNSTIGARTNFGEKFAGQIAEVLIYNKTLSGPDIEAMYASSGAWHSKGGLISRWSMENNGISTGQAHLNGSTVKDSFGGNDGTISDGADNSMILESSPTRKKRGRR